MKKILLLLFIVLLLFGCETQEERNERRQKEEAEKITKELVKKEIPKEVQDWVVSTTLSKTITIFCITTSKKCIEEKSIAEELKTEYDLNIYYLNLDELSDDVKKLYKTTYKMKDYTGYLPYFLIVDSKKVLSTHTDLLKKDDFVKYLKEYKIISD